MTSVSVHDLSANAAVSVGTSAPVEPSALRQGWDFLRRRWTVILMAASLVVVLASLALWWLPPRFTAHAVVLLDPRRDKVFGADDTLPATSPDAGTVESAMAVAKSNAVLARVVEAEHLAYDPDFNGARARPGLKARLRAWLGRGQPLPSAAIQALGTLHRALVVERVGKAYILSLGVTAGTAEKSARLANALASAFVRDQRDAYLEATRRKALFYAERLAPLSDQLRHAEQALDAFRHDNDLLVKSPSGQNPTSQATINEQQLAELNSRLVAARAVTADARARWDQARQIVAANGQLDAVPEVVGSAAIAQLRQQQAEVARKEADLASHYADGHPALMAARAEKREIDRNIGREVARIVANLKGSYDIAATQEQGLMADLGRATAAAGVDSDLGLRLRELERVRTVDQTLFETYLTRAKEAEQQANYEERDIRVISPAEVPSVPAVPQASLALALALAVGLGLGIAVGLAMDAFENGFVTPEQVEAAFALPVLAAVPWLSARDRTIEGRVVDLPRFLASAPQSRYAEAVHAVRAGIRRSGGSPAGIVLVTSLASGEGKSNLALSLGFSAARSGQRVLLLDADLRRPAMSRYFGFEHRLGLVDMLSGLVGTAETTVPLAPGLAIMPSGRATSAAPDLFASRRMAHYLDFVRRSYDLVVIDAAPSADAVDAAILAELSDRIVFVVKWRSTACAAARHALDALGQRRKVAGIVLNAVNRSRMPRLGRSTGHLRAEPFHAVA